MAGYLPASGNSLSMSQINSVFDSRGNNLNAYRGTTWYTAAGGSGTFSSGTISFNDFYLKGPSPAVTISLASILDIDGAAFPPTAAFAEYRFQTDGTITYGNNSTFSGSMGNWASPTTTGIGSSYWVRFTETASDGDSTVIGSARGVWIQMSSARIFGLEKTTGGLAYRVYTIQIATDSGGSNIVATKTGATIYVESIV